MPSAKTGGLPAGEAADTYFRQGGNSVYYQVSKEFFDKLPNACFGAVAVCGLDNTHDIPELEKMLAGNVAECEAYFTGKKPKETEDILPYRAAFTALGINPNKFMCSIEALLTRIAKGKGFPHINAAVDLGNAVSIKHRLPMGAHDLDTIADGLDVRLAEEGDTVRAGEMIGAVGKTGMATGAHLHFEVRQDGEPQNPVAYFDSDVRDTLRMG